MAQTHVECIKVYEDPGVYLRIKAQARCKGVGIARWCRDAIRRELKEAENGKAS